jgi:peptide-methionine (R)-S-oxide reductase
MTKLFAGALIVAVLAAAAYSETQAKNEAAETNKPQPVPNDGLAASAARGAKEAAKAKVDPAKIDWKKVNWRKRLTRLQYHITREAGTERPFKNEYWDHFEEGDYQCVSCGLPLFESDSKFDAHCGWPSFDRTVSKNAVTTHIDRKLVYPRKEIRCRRCGAHLGHVFDDGPTETGQRYCMNSAAMKFVPAKGAVKNKNALGDASDGSAASAASSGKPAAEKEKSKSVRANK